MGAHFQMETPGRSPDEHLPTSGFFQRLAQSVFELGEIARIEIEITRSYPYTAPQPRCPLWHEHAGGGTRESLAATLPEMPAHMAETPAKAPTAFNVTVVLPP